MIPMRWAAVICVMLQLLLRGAAVPHGHAACEEVPFQDSRAHVHLTWHDDEHSEQCACPHEGSCDACEECGASAGAVIFLDDVLVVDVSPEQPNPVVIEIDWIATRFGDGVVAPSLATISARSLGNTAGTVYALFPHVLRV